LRRGHRFPQALGASPPCRDAAAAGQQQGRALARQAGLRGTRVAGLPAGAYGNHKDARAAWAAGVLAVDAGPGAAAAEGTEGRESPADFRELWEERTAIMVYDGRLPPTEGG